MARRQFADLGFLDPLCGMVQVRRRQTSSGRVNPGYGDPDRGTSVVQLRPIALRRGQFADRYPVTPVLACKQVWRKWRARLIWTIEKRRWDCAGCRAQSARVWEGDGATARAFCRSVHILGIPRGQQPYSYRVGLLLRPTPLAAQ